MQFVIAVIVAIGQVLSILIVIHSIMSFFLPPTNAIRALVEKVLNPMLNPIRRLVKPINGMDFSPMILLIVIYLLEWVLTRVLTRII